MANWAIEAVKRSINLASRVSRELYFNGLKNPRWWALLGEASRDKISDSLQTAEAFNAELEDCWSCIAPKRLHSGLRDPDIIALVITHFREVAQRCENYADALEVIAAANFEGAPE